MAAITTNEVTAAVAERVIDAPGRTRRRVTVSFPTGANAGTNNAYVTGGIGLDLGKLGCRVRLQWLCVIGVTPVAGNNNPRWIWNGNIQTPTLVALGNNTAGAPDSELANTVTFATAQTLVLDVEGF
jgi:hypothetical protein